MIKTGQLHGVNFIYIDSDLHNISESEWSKLLDYSDLIIWVDYLIDKDEFIKIIDEIFNRTKIIHTNVSGNNSEYYHDIIDQCEIQKGNEDFLTSWTADLYDGLDTLILPTEINKNQCREEIILLDLGKKKIFDQLAQYEYFHADS